MAEDNNNAAPEEPGSEVPAAAALAQAAAAPEEGNQQQQPPAETRTCCGLVERYADVVAAYPAAVCGGVLGALLLFFVVSFGLATVMGGELITVDFSLETMVSRGDKVANRGEALEAAHCGGPCEDDDDRRRLLAPWPLGRRLEDDRRGGFSRQMTVAYVSKEEDANVLTEELLPQALELERRAAEVLGEPTHTLLGNIFPAYPSASGMKTGGSLQQELRALAELSTSDDDKGRLWPSFDLNFTECDLGSSLVTSTFYGAAWEWRDIYGDTLPYIETDDLYLTFFWGAENEPEVFAVERDNLISQDMLLLAGVGLMAFVLMVLQMQSIFLALAGLLAILLATIAALCLYRVFVSNWFGILNSFSFFLLLGIACDDVFVLADAWRQSVEAGGIVPDDYRGRLRYMLPRAGGAVTTTSLTTAGAFFGNAISIIPPTRLFGIFSGCMVLADWFLTVTLLPAIFVLQHKWFGGAWCERRQVQGEEPQPRLVDRLLARKVAPCVLRFAPALLVSAAVLAAVSLNIALELKSAAEWHNSDLLPFAHNQRRAHRAQKAMKNLRPEYAYLEVVYGVVPEDTGDMNNPQSASDVVWADPVDISSPAVQVFTRDLCKDLLAMRNMTRQVWSCWGLRAESLAADRGIPFPIQDANIFHQEPWHWDGARRMPEGEGWWFTIGVELTLKSDSSVADTREAYDEWEVFMEKWNKEAEHRGLQSLSSGFQTSGRWRFMSTIEAMANSAIAACGISIAIVAVMLLITMRNLVIVSVIIANVLAVCLAAVSCLVLEGRGLGVIEGIGMTLIVGLSVDYLVHVAKAYMDTPASMTRGQKALHAMAHLGGSVCAAAATTALSAAFLCFGKITFFVAFGRFVIAMMGFSVLFTFFSLVPFLHLFGPEAGFGDLRCPRRFGFGRSGAQGREEEEKTALTAGLAVPAVCRRHRMATAAFAAAALIGGGAVRLGLHLAGEKDEPSACGAPTSLDFTFEQFAIPAHQDSYRCRDFDLVPAGCTYYVTGWEPIIAPGSLSFVHHMILFSTQRAPSQCTFTCFDMPDAIGTDAAWAVGGGELKFPDGMALAVGGTKHALQIHYSNYLLKSGLVDVRSGLRLKLSPTPPATTIAAYFLGLHPRGDLRIPPMSSNSTFSVDCRPKLLGDVTVVAYATHAHKLGFSVMSDLRRPVSPGSLDTESVGDVGSTPNFNFNYQTITNFEENDYRTMKPGDTVRLHCSYNSMNRFDETRGGFGSEDEMCMTTLYVAPAGNLADTGCWEWRAEWV